MSIAFCLFAFINCIVLLVNGKALSFSVIFSSKMNLSLWYLVDTAQLFYSNLQLQLVKWKSFNSCSFILAFTNNKILGLVFRAVIVWLKLTKNTPKYQTYSVLMFSKCMERPSLNTHFPPF